MVMGMVFLLTAYTWSFTKDMVFDKLRKALFITLPTANIGFVRR
jgi:hypothetical protein